ncbi:MAG TPA: phosphoribosylaminoimidazolesuccinocarboxamide synthase, partial [Rhizomicrobium sp.]|nr:phosphoribosylaminoimidazolesuccinocarboxamide synthase [Rhizomicrobium sp.]
MTRYGCGYALGHIAARPRNPVSLQLTGPRAEPPFSRTISMKRRRVIYEGKAKILYEGTEPGTVIQYFKDDATAGNGAKKDTIEGKGVLNNR